MTDTASMGSVDTTPQQRKNRHLEVCLGPRKKIECSGALFEDIRLVHHPLPELDWQQLDTGVAFLGHTLARPFFISCMTGGADAALRVNQHLVRAAQQAGIPVGLGSMRVLLKHPELFDHFQVKSLAPDVPVWANLGAAQLPSLPVGDLIEWLKRLEVQALVLHCNVGQELCQPSGDRCFTGIIQHIQRLCEQAPIPILVKETGFGLRPQDVTALASLGVAAVDIAGAGGTNWMLVESLCHPSERLSWTEGFRNWGNPTGVVLAALDPGGLPVIASGGIRSGVDIAKCIALGAHLVGLALPFIRAESQDGLDGVLAYIDTLTQALKTSMLLTGSRTIADLGHAGLILSDSFIAQVRQYRQPEQWRHLVQTPA